MVEPDSSPAVTSGLMKIHPLPLTASLLLALNLSSLAVTRYVDLNNLAPSPPFTDWSAAATNIQDAIDVAADGDLILVADGIYSTGGRVVYGSLTNRVVVDKAVTVQSANGPEVTIIEGYQVPDAVVGDAAVRCVYLTNGAALIGFTLTNGATRKVGDSELERSGGGLWCESAEATASNCVLVANSCYWKGGGVQSGTLVDCALIGNTNSNYGCAEGAVIGPWGCVGAGIVAGVLTTGVLNEVTKARPSGDDYRACFPAAGR